MDALIDDVKIDAKHSFEDTVVPVTEAKRLWGQRVALLGGLDVDFIARPTKRPSVAACARRSPSASPAAAIASASATG